MEQRGRRKSFLAIVIIFTVMAALLVPAPVYAAGPGHEPPPPKPPTNDLGKKDKPDGSPSHPAVDLPGDTSLVVTNNGTPLPLASLLSAKAISANSPAKPVRFCKGSNPGFFGDCTSYASIEDAINSVGRMHENPTGVFYVALNYPKPDIAQGPAIVIDQGTFYNPDGEANLDMLGGYIFSGAGVGTQSKHPTELIRPVNILNFNENSSFSMDNFDIYIWALVDDYLSPDYHPADIHVTDSHNVSLSDLTITSWSTAWDGTIDIENSENVQLNGIKMHHYSVGPGIQINQSSNVTLKDISINTEGYNGIAITGSGQRADPDYPANEKNTWDPSISLDNVFVHNYEGWGSGASVVFSDHVSIKNSTFIVNRGTYEYATYPYPAVEADSSEYITLDNVTALGNDRGDGVQIFVCNNTLMNNVTANSTDFNGASILWSGGSITITNSHFDGSGVNGLYGERIGDDLTLNNVTANGNGLYGFVADTPGSLVVLDSRFNGNGAGGMVAAGGNLVSLSGVVADHNGSFGAGVYNAGAFLSLDPQFLSDFGEISLLYQSPPTGIIDIHDSTFSANGGWGLQAMAAPLPGYYPPGYSGDGEFPVNEGNFITLDGVVANHNEDAGILTSISSFVASSPVLPEFGDSLNAAINIGNFLSLNHITADENGTNGIQALISAITGNIPWDAARAAQVNAIPGSPVHIAINMGNFISLDGVEANHNGETGVLIGNQAWNPDVWPPLASPAAPVAEGTSLTSDFSSLVDFDETAGNFTTLKHVTANRNGMGGIESIISAEGTSSYEVDAENYLPGGEEVTAADNPVTINTHSAATTLVTLITGNQANMWDVAANDNGAFGIENSILSNEVIFSSIEMVGPVTYFYNTIQMGDGRANLRSTVDDRMHLTLVSGNQINMDGVSTSGNTAGGLFADISTSGNIQNIIYSGDMWITSIDKINKSDGPANLFSGGDIARQVDLISGDRINLSNVRANENADGVIAQIGYFDSPGNGKVISNAIAGSLTTWVDNSINGEVGDAALTYDWDNSLKANVFSGSQINLDDVQANHNRQAGVISTIETRNSVDNYLIEGISAGHVVDYSIRMTSGSGRVAVTLDNSVDARIEAGNLINFQNLEANNNSDLACLGCLSGGVSAYIFSEDVIANYLLPSISGNLLNSVDLQAGNDSHVSAVMTSNLNGAILSGNTINLDGVDANHNAGAGVVAQIQSATSTYNDLLPLFSAVLSQASSSTVDARIDNNLQTLLNCGNSIFMQDVSARSNRSDGLAAVINVAEGDIAEDLDGSLQVSVLNTVTGQSGNGTEKSVLNNEFGTNVFNGDSIEMDGIDASFNGGMGMNLSIRTAGIKQNSFRFRFTTDSNNQMSLDDGLAKLATDEDNNLWVNTHINNLIRLTGAVADFNRKSGVDASIHTANSDANDLDLTLTSKGVDFVGIENGDASLTSNVSDNNQGTLLDINKITLEDLVASGNSFAGVNAQIETFNQEINHVIVKTYADQSNEISCENGLPDLNSDTVFDANSLVSSSNSIDILDVMANLNGGDGVVALSTSNDMVENYGVALVRATVTNIINHVTLAETLLPSAPAGAFATYNTLDTINLAGVTADQNALSGTLLKGDVINVVDSAFISNGHYGLDLSAAKSSLVNVRACRNVSGPEIHSANLFTDNFDTSSCPEENGTGEAAAGKVFSETPGALWQIINVYMDPGQNSGTLSCQFGTTFLYLEKMAAGNFEWGRVELAPCIVPGGTTGTLTGLGQATLPAALPDGVTFQGKAFDFELNGTASLGGTMNVRFSLPAGFTLSSGKKLAILWFDPTAKRWVELTTYAGGGYANAYASQTGAFVLVIK